MLFMTNIKCYAQDLIITNEKDTIVCKIQKLENDFIFYRDTVDTDEKAISSHRVIELYYAGQRVEYESRNTPRKYIIFKQPEWRIDAGYGWSFYLELPTDDFGPGYEEFFNSVRNGNNFYIEVSKYPDIRFGGGLEFQYSNFYSSNNEVTVFDSLLVLKGIGRVQEDVHLFYLQPKGYYSIFSSTWDFTAGGGIILAYLRRTIKLLEDTYAYRGVSFGVGLSAAIDHKLSTNLAVGIRTSIGLAFLSDVQLNGQSIELSEEDYLSASQFSLCFGVKYLW